MPNGQQWRTAMVNVPVFTDRTPQGFYERLLASKPMPDTGKPDPQKMAAFLDRHPETVAAMKIIKQSPPSAGFADSTFHGLNAFWFTNSAGASVPGALVGCSPAGRRGWPTEHRSARITCSTNSSACWHSGR